MRANEKILLSIKESVVYGVLSSGFVLIVLLIEELFTKVSCEPGFSCGGAERGIPIGCVFIGTTLSVFVLKSIFGHIRKSGFVKWLSILIISSFTSILFQMIFLIYFGSMTVAQIISNYVPDGINELFAVRLMIKLFLILLPFTILYANRFLIIEIITNRNSLK